MHIDIFFSPNQGWTAKDGFQSSQTNSANDTTALIIRREALHLNASQSLTFSCCSQEYQSLQMICQIFYFLLFFKNAAALHNIWFLICMNFATNRYTLAYNHYSTKYISEYICLVVLANTGSHFKLFALEEAGLLNCLLMYTYRQKLELKSTEAGPRMKAGKQVASIIKALDSNYVAISLMADPVSHECKSCPSVSHKEIHEKKFNSYVLLKWP